MHSYYCSKRIPKIFSLPLCILILASSFTGTAFAAELPQLPTPNYKVAYYAFDCYHMMDENGRRYGYGYEMMQEISNYLQCTFSYEGYDKTAAECVDMLRSGEVDIYTAAKKDHGARSRVRIFHSPGDNSIHLHECQGRQYED